MKIYEVAMILAFLMAVVAPEEDVIDSEEDLDITTEDYGIKDLDYDLEAKQEYSSINPEDIEEVCKEFPHGLNRDGDNCDS